MINHRTRILVVEDSSTQAKIEKLILEGEGFEVEIVPDGESGLERISDTNFDLVLSDVVMPGMSGYELCRKIKAHPRGRHVPVVLLTALSELNNLVEGLRVGADNFITKPFDPLYLIDRVKRVLSGKSQDSPMECDPDTGVCLMDKGFVMTLDRKRILDYLVSTFDDYFRCRQKENEQRMLEAKRRSEIAEQREAFLTSLARDLKTPISKANEKIDTLIGDMNGNSNPRQIEILNQLRQDNQTMLDLIQKLFYDYKIANKSEIPFTVPPDHFHQPYNAV